MKTENKTTNILLGVIVVLLLANFTSLGMGKIASAQAGSSSEYSLSISDALNLGEDRDLSVKRANEFTDDLNAASKRGWRVIAMSAVMSQGWTRVYALTQK